LPAPARWHSFVLTTKNGQTEDTARAIMVKPGLNLFLFGSEYLPNHTFHIVPVNNSISIFSTKCSILIDVVKHMLTIQLGLKNIFRRAMTHSDVKMQPSTKTFVCFVINPERLLAYMLDPGQPYFHKTDLL
jgi:hypothetical protein